MAFGTAFLLAFSGGLMGMWGFRAEWLSDSGARAVVRRLVLGTWGMAILAWLTVILGTYVIYPWYRAKPPLAATARLTDYPRSLLLSKPQTAQWHEFGMEWKEHIAWFAPILATAVAFVVTRYRKQFFRESGIRAVVVVLYSVAFFCAVVAGLLGALIDKAAPLR